jgi:N-acetylneuraminic acid mutarotase
VALCFSSVDLVGALGDSWVSKASIPVAMSVYGSVTFEGKIYVFGCDANGGLTYLYDPSTDSWTQKTCMPTCRTGFSVVVCGDKIYCIGGTVGSGVETMPSTVNEVYDPSTDTWNTKASMPLNVTGVDANVVNGKIYVVGGLLPIEVWGVVPDISNATQIYDSETDTWIIATSQVPTPVYRYASSVVEGKIYVAGGSSSSETPTNTFQIYDVATDSWTYGPSLLKAVRSPAGVSTLGIYASECFYVIGGDGGSYPAAYNQIYDIQSQSWSYGTDFPTTHDWITDGITATNLDDTLYLIGGLSAANEGFYEITQQYIPQDYSGTLSTSSTAPTPTIPEFSKSFVFLVMGGLAFITVIAILTIIKANNQRDLSV